MPFENSEVWNVVIMDLETDGFRLPTSSEWGWAAIVAARGNPGQVNETRWAKPFAESDGTKNANDYARHVDNSGGTSHPMGPQLLNELGLYDMNGNVWEWMWDWWSERYATGVLIDPTGPRSGTYQATRGGSWNHQPMILAVAGSSPWHRLDRGGFRIDHR
jgi:formylglycine-generating enzyme